MAPEGQKQEAERQVASDDGSAAGPAREQAVEAAETARPRHAPAGGGPDLDPEALAICHRLAGRLFPWDTTRALELALLKTFCVPSIAALLDRTGEFAQRPRKRYDDTGLMVAELRRDNLGTLTPRLAGRLG